MLLAPVVPRETPDIMAARSALQRTLEDTSRPEDEIFADALAVAREKKLATDYIVRISDDLFRDAEHRAGTTLTEKPGKRWARS